MGAKNQTDVLEFLLLGLTDDPEMLPFLFVLFLFMHLLTILGNLLIVLLVISDSHLHTPMYFFLSNLSLTDICISATTIPKMLVNIQAQNQSITYKGCLSQIGFVLVLGGFENFLLAVMAYDRYVAICHPLRYTIIMNPRHCGLLVAFSLILSAMNALLHCIMVLRLSFCRDLQIPHFFCELAQVIKLACSDTFINHILINFVTCLLLGGVPLSGIIFSYSQIISSVLRMKSKEGKMKAFSTCGSHLSVSSFYGTVFGVSITSAITDSSEKSAVASVMYIIIPQMVNPFIYSLKNRDMKEALRKLIAGMPFFSVFYSDLGILKETT